MKMLLIYLLVLVGFCRAAETSLLHLSKLLNSGEIVKIDCYIGKQLTDIKEIGRLGKYLTEESEYSSVETKDLLSEFNLIFNRRSFVKKKILVSPKLRTYNVFIIFFSDKSRMTLINSSGFEEDQFVFGEISDKENEQEIREIELFIRVDRDEEMVSLRLQGFQKSDFLRRVVKTKTR